MNTHVCRLPEEEDAASTTTRATLVIPAAGACGAGVCEAGVCEAGVCKAAAHTALVNRNQCSAHGKYVSHLECDPTSSKQLMLVDSMFFILQTGKRSQMW